jgi:hypothetical protein
LGCYIDIDMRRPLHDRKNVQGRMEDACKSVSISAMERRFQTQIPYGDSDTPEIYVKQAALVGKDKGEYYLTASGKPAVALEAPITTCQTGDRRLYFDAKIQN